MAGSSAQGNYNLDYKLNRLYYKVRQIENTIATLEAGSGSGLTKAEADTYYRPISYVPAFSALTSKPTTISGYGITDGVTLTDTQTLTNKTVNSVTPTIFGYLDFTSSGQTQLNTITSNVNANTTAISGKQATLISGTNIRTVNGNSLLGSTDLVTPLTTDASTLTTGTLPDARLSSSVVNLTGTQTLTGKTLSGASNTFSAIPNTAITGLGTISTQNSNAVAITGGTITGLSGTVNTSVSFSSPYFESSGSTSFGGAAAGTNGIRYRSGGHTNTDSVTAASGTVAHVVNYGFSAPQLAALNTLITYTTASTLYIAGPPTQGSNVTITNPYALNVNSGNVLINTGSLTVGNTVNSSAFVAAGYYDSAATASTGVGTYRIGGSNALHTKGTQSAYIGAAAGNLTNTGSNNIGAGYGALNAITSGSNNTAIGYAAGFYATTGGGNTFLGASTAFKVGTTTTLTNTTFIGNSAGQNITGLTHTRSVFIGYDAGNGEANSTDIAFFGNSTNPLNPKIYGTTNTAALQTGYVAKTAAYTIGANDYTVNADGTGAAYNITLPTAVGIAGKIFVIRKSDVSANVITVATTSSQTINASTTYPLPSQYKYVTVQSDGANYMVIANN